MLKKEFKLKSKKEFSETKEIGRMIQFQNFGFLVNKIMITDDQTNKKFGFVVSKKISKRAVDRNRVKRLLNEMVRKNLDIFPNGFRGIFLVKKMINNEADIKKDIEVLQKTHF